MKQLEDILQTIPDEVPFMPIMSLEEDEETVNAETYADSLPIIPLKNTVLFPGVVLPITIGRDKSIKAIERAYAKDKIVAVLSQKDTKTENPVGADLFMIGTVARIIKIIKMPDGSITAILQGRKRCELIEMLTETPYMQGIMRVLEYDKIKDTLEYEAIIASVKDIAAQIIDLSPNIPTEANVVLKNINNPAFLINFLASNLGIKIGIKQQILEINDLTKRASLLFQHMDGELQLLELREKIESKVRGDIEKQQRDYYLHQQLKTIQDELGQNPQEEDFKILAERATKKKWDKSIEEVFQREFMKLRRMNPQVAEYSINMNYLDTFLELPWNEYTQDNFELEDVKKVLDKDHSGLDKVKERILEHLAVLKLRGDMKAPILCLVGPPGVGKTSLGASIAKAMKRNYTRIALGGLHDEAEVRGHRKTYIGAMPGRIIQSLKKVKSANPVFILDEIDKVGKDFRGDPSSALLEALDPEQNKNFYDNYLEVEFDLSKVLFIATANSLSTIQPALLDRMEIIDISGYSIEEKVDIAKKHLIPQLRVEHGLRANQIKLTDAVITKVIQEYTRESGVRNLNRQLGSIMRHVAKNVAMQTDYNPTVKIEELPKIFGPVRFDTELYQERQVPGVAIGLAWTAVGGDILFIEAGLHKGNGKLTLTGNLGDVMKESAHTALSFIKSNAEKMGIDPQKFSESDIHIHVPEGAIPKDGPSAGITMLTALTSIFKNKPVQPYLAMTGEITLRGKVLPVGGIKEKILAAKRAGIRNIILCKDNKRHVEDINKEYITNLTFHYVDTMQEVVALALK
ncbi:MAG: endopeptidase La [Saprospiraceae bacterium]|nr:endopeptidase La [Saprospiraceae bacterium]MBP7679605.1 endopeptidase La [Saprospiraceae bacterium]